MKADCSRVCGKPSAAMPASARAACQMAGGVGEGEGAAWIDGGDGEARCGSSRVASRDFHGVVDKPLHDSRSTWLPHERAISACLSRHSSALATRCSKRIPLSRACCRHAPCTWKAQGHVVVAAIHWQAARQDSGARTAHDAKDSGARTAHDARGMKLEVCLRCMPPSEGLRLDRHAQNLRSPPHLPHSQLRPQGAQPICARNSDTLTTTTWPNTPSTHTPPAPRQSIQSFHAAQSTMWCAKSWGCDRHMVATATMRVLLGMAGERGTTCI